MKPRHDIYATVTDQLVTAIEAGAGNWRMPWHHSGAPLMRPTSVAGRCYSGINRLVLWATADACGYASGTWATYQQWQASGAQVRKGQLGTHVILWKKVERGDAAAKVGGKGEGKARFFARSFVVFNRDQVDGAGNRIRAGRDRRGDLRVLGVHQPDDLEGRHLVQRGGGRVARFGQQVIDRHVHPTRRFGEAVNSSAA